ncbi:MAG: DNA-formamidopyrimidine glycosylase, partial [Anaerolineae bacterium]
TVGRRGKYIVISCQPKYLLIHLRMTGRLIYAPLASEPHPLASDKHTHVIIEFSDGSHLYFRDTRKFGRLFLVDDPSQVVTHLGVEPLDADFTPAELADLVTKRHRQLKPLLLDQRVVAGLGNIYVDEALWQAQLHPLRSADSLSPCEVESLNTAIKDVLDCALIHHGTTLRDYRDPDDQSGANESCLQVYGRAGMPCSRCGTPIKRIIVGQRSTHICPHCQELV